MTESKRAAMTLVEAISEEHAFIEVLFLNDNSHTMFTTFERVLIFIFAAPVLLVTIVLDLYILLIMYPIIKIVFKIERKIIDKEDILKVQPF